MLQHVSSATLATTNTSNPVLHSLCWLSGISNLVQGLGPYLQGALKDQRKFWTEDPGHQLCSSRTREFSTIKVKLVCAEDWTFSVASLSLWNELPQKLKTITNLIIFLSKCKAHFCDLAFSTYLYITHALCYMFIKKTQRWQEERTNMWQILVTLLNALWEGTLTTWWWSIV